MSNLTEVPTDELLSFQDYPTTHTSFQTQQTTINLQDESPTLEKRASDNLEGENTPENGGSNKSFWTIEYYQQFFDVETKDVVDRIVSSVIPRQNNALITQIKQRPDLYGPFWISVTLIFTIAISGNISNYLQHANIHYKWKYDFHLVSYAATTIFLYITVIPLGLWGLLKWSSDVNDLEGLEADVKPKALELICIYGYSLFIYIPASILWTIQVGWLQWLLVIVAACISGSVLIFTLLPSFKLSRHKLFLIVGATACHVLLAAGFMLYFFHVPNSEPTNGPLPEIVSAHAKVDPVN